MEVCRLCLDLLHDNSFSQLDEPFRAVVNVVAPEVDFEISSNPVFCKQCFSSVDELHKFKAKLIENELRIKTKCKGEIDDKLSLKELLYGVSLGEIVVTEKAKERICRTCLDSIDCESFTVLKPSKPDAYLDSMIKMCLPELDLEVARDPVMCEKCLGSLQKLHHLKTSCLDVEEKLKNYCTNYGTNSKAKINLHSVLETLVDTNKDTIGCVNIKTEIESESLDEDVEMNNKSIKVEKDTDALNEEEMEIKTEECNLHETNYFRCNLHETKNFCHRERQRIRRSTTELDSEYNKQDGIIPCDQCNNKFKNKERMLVHRMQHFGQKPPTCKVCNAQFATNGSLNFHKKIHISKEPFKCKVCDRQFVNASYYHRHVQSHTENNFYACDQCNEVFLNFQRLKVHKLVHVGKKPLVCEICNMTFPYKSSYKSHRNTHLDKSEQPYACDVCGARFAVRSILVTHRIIHFGKRPYGCAICDMRFTQKSNLKKHILLHSGKKTFICDVCKKSFFTKNTLQSHLETHYGEKPYICNECGENFRHKAKLEVHQLTHRGKEPFKCDICGSDFAKKWKLKTHRKTHDGERPFECPFCLKRFVKQWILESHTRIHTGEYNFKCELCDRRYVDQGKLNFHLKQKCLNPAYTRTKKYLDNTKGLVKDEKPFYYNDTTIEIN